MISISAPGFLKPKYTIASRFHPYKRNSQEEPTETVQVVVTFAHRSDPVHGDAEREFLATGRGKKQNAEKTRGGGSKESSPLALEDHPFLLPLEPHPGTGLR